jgi:hypothetical protein
MIANIGAWTAMRIDAPLNSALTPSLFSVGKSTQEVYVSNRDAVFANSGFQRVWKDLIRKEEVAKKKGGWNEYKHDV